MTRNQKIIAATPRDNAPAELDGNPGYWAQGDCRFQHGAATPEAAVAMYRDKLSRGEIGVNHNRGCDTIYGIIRQSNFDDFYHRVGEGLTNLLAGQHPGPELSDTQLMMNQVTPLFNQRVRELASRLGVILGPEPNFSRPGEPLAADPTGI